MNSFPEVLEKDFYFFLYVSDFSCNLLCVKYWFASESANKCWSVNSCQSPLAFILWPLYALHLFLCPPSRDDAEVHLPHRNLSEFTVVLLRLIRSLFPAGVHDLARVRKTSSVHKQSCSEFFLRIGTVFATSLPLACFWDKNWIFFRMIQMIWELSRRYRISAEGLQSVQNIWKVCGRTLPDL